MARDPIDDRDDAPGGSPDPLLQFFSEHRLRTERRRRRLRLGRPSRTVVLLLGAGAGIGLLALGLLLWGSSDHPVASHGPAPGTSSRKPPATKPPKHGHPATTRVDRGGAPKSARSKPIRVRLTAARNDSWVQIRAGSSTGRVLFAGVVARGQSIRAVGRGRLWARFGSLGNFDVTVNGRLVRPAFDGTVDTLITASAIRPAPATG